MTKNESMRHVEHEKACLDKRSVACDFGAAAIRSDKITSVAEVPDSGRSTKLNNDQAGAKEVTRNGKKFIFRNLDDGDLTPKEEAAEARARRLDGYIDERAEDIAGTNSSSFPLPKEINTAKGVTKEEKQVVREIIGSMVRAIDGELLLRAEEYYRREAMRTDEFEGLPEDEFDENGNPKPLS